MRPLAVAAAAVLALLVPAGAEGHPLGNFSVNHLAEISVSSDRIDVRYVLDGAEIPTFQHQVTADKVRAAVHRRLTLPDDGPKPPLDADGPIPTPPPPGRGGLPTTRVVIPLTARAHGSRV